MKFKFGMLLSTLAVLASIAVCVVAQPPGRVPSGSQVARTAESFVAKWLTMDENHDGKLDKDELKDKRLESLFQRSDTNKDGILDADEMKSLFHATNDGQSHRGRKGAGPEGSGGPGGADGAGGRPRRPPSN